MQFDQILVYLGAFGTYQKRVYFLLCLISIPGAWHKLGQVFLGGSVDHWCATPELDYVNCTYWDLDQSQCAVAKRDAAIPTDEEGSYESCLKYNLTGIPFYPGINTSDYNNKTISCNAGWKYDNTKYESTINTDYNLVCNRESLANIAQSVFFAGNLAGSIIFGIMADWIGRSPTMLIALIIWVSSALGTAFAPDIYVFMALRFFVSCGSYGTFLPAYIIGTEFVGISKRPITGIASQIAFAVGLMSLAGLAYFIRNWRYLQLAISIPIVLLFLYIPFLAESARWLITRGKHVKAEKIIRRVAQVNKKELPDVLFEPHEISKQKEKQKQGNASVLTLFKTPYMAFKTVNLMWNWCVNSLVYYGISLNIPNLGTNSYLAFFFSGLVEIPAYLYAIWACQHFGGRKFNLTGALLLAGGSCLLTGFLPPGVAVTCVAMVGKFAASASFSIVYIFSAEIYPTPVRSAGTGISSAASRIGGMVSPLIFLVGTHWTPLPFVLFGTCAISAGLLTLLLPETRGKSLPETLEEGENFGKPKWMGCSSDGTGERSRQETKGNVINGTSGNYTALPDVES
ncbi:organic cation transporter protein-like [Amphiura filiformis]|uniref:organic cation transporter protein-like n=1 Tax=Amphiura filiformis TaxID=82378 RepID=UPI003B21FE4A